MCILTSLPTDYSSTHLLIIQHYLYFKKPPSTTKFNFINDKPTPPYVKTIKAPTFTFNNTCTFNNLWYSKSNEDTPKLDKDINIIFEDDNPHPHSNHPTSSGEENSTFEDDNPSLPSPCNDNSIIEESSTNLID